MTQTIKKVTYFFIIYRFFKLQVSNTLAWSIWWEGGIHIVHLSKLAWQTWWEGCLKKKEKDYTVNKVPCLLTRWLLPLNLPVKQGKQGLFTSLHGSSWFEVLLSVATTLFEYYCHPNKCSFRFYRVTLSLLITSTVVNWRENAAIQDWYIV